MENQPYYLSYETRYKAVYEAGAERWGHSPDDQELYSTLKKWVTDNHLMGKKVIEFACGEGAGGVILSELGCCYHGVDISPSAVMTAKEALKKYSNARVDILDMVKETISGKYDAALDCMGFHMLIIDEDRKSYLRNAFLALNNDSPMLFYKESYNREKIVKSPVKSYDEWLKITGDDYETPSVRRVDMENGQIEIMLPFVPARANDKHGYITELKLAGFTVEKFIEMNFSNDIQHSASIYVRKP